MIDYILLKSFMMRKEISVSKLSELLGLSRQATSNKINGKSSMSLDDAQKLSNILQLSNEEICLVFFNNKEGD